MTDKEYIEAQITTLKYELICYDAGIHICQDDLDFKNKIEIEIRRLELKLSL